MRCDESVRSKSEVPLAPVRHGFREPERSGLRRSIWLLAEAGHPTNVFVGTPSVAIRQSHQIDRQTNPAVSTGSAERRVGRPPQSHFQRGSEMVDKSVGLGPSTWSGPWAHQTNALIPQLAALAFS